LQHIEEHGDVTLLNRLVLAMPKGSRVNALCAWAESYGKVVFNDETNEFQHSKESSTLLDEAIETSWVEFKEPPAYKSMNFDKKLNALLKSALARIDANKGDVIDKVKLQAVIKASGYTKEEA
jgi:hypothetical protein